MNKTQIIRCLEEEGYTVKGVVIGPSECDEKIGVIRDSSVEVFHGNFYLPGEVEERIGLVETLETLRIPYTEVLDKEVISGLCGVEVAKEDFKESMIAISRKFLSLAERVGSFEFK